MEPNQSLPAREVERMMKTHDVILKAMAKKISWLEAAEIIESIRNLLLQDYQRKTIDGSLGRWFCIKKPRATYFALAGQGYPERLAYQLLNVA